MPRNAPPSLYILLLAATGALSACSSSEICTGDSCDDELAKPWELQDIPEVVFPDDDFGPGPDDVILPVDTSPLYSSAAHILDPDLGGAHFGYDTKIVGDVNGDGYDDVIVGSRDMETSTAWGVRDEGMAHLFYGSASGISDTAAWTVSGGQAYAYMGQQARAAGDVNGDGYADVLVTSFRYDNGEVDEGMAYVFLGSASGLSTTPDWSYESNQASAMMGWGVSGGGDLNGDGYDDIAIGAYNWDDTVANQGAVFIFYGSETGLPSTPGTTLLGARLGYSFGYGVAIAGDVDADGYDDLAVGASGYYRGEGKEGAVYLYRGGASGVASSYSFRWESNTVNAFAGRVVAAAGDVDGDGYADFLMNASDFDHGATNRAGRFVLFYGNASAAPTRTFDSESYDWPTTGVWQRNGELGFSVAGAGDLDNDGYSDFLVSQRLYTGTYAGEGRTFVFRGSAAGPTLYQEFNGEQANAWFGYSVGGGGDINGDDFDDYVVSAALLDYPTPNEGAVFVMHGGQTDTDHDGDPDVTDCEPTDPAIHAGAVETCNDIDDDCDSVIDNVSAPLWYPDLDLDGYGDASGGVPSCDAIEGYLATGTDCDDDDASVHPGATEICNETDDDCDGTVDEGVQNTYYADTDVDGYGNSTSTTLACSVPEGYVENSTDCNDAVGTIHPGADEYCNGIDDDCDRIVDETPVDATTWYRDIDGDDWGNTSRPYLACTRPTGWAAVGGDCNDNVASINPAANEVCNNVDDNCNGVKDDDPVDGTVWYTDADTDGYGDATSGLLACTAPSGRIATGGDCDDANNAVNPAASEVCNSVDDDCDGLVDDDPIDASTWYADVDGDLYGNAAASQVACSAPEGYIGDATDCDDTLNTVNPGAAELCNEVDDDCDGLVDDDPVDTVTFYADADTDGYGNPSVSEDACSAPEGFIANDEDCDDEDAAVNPAATELCNDVDDDCDGLVDDDPADAVTFYADADADGYGNAEVTEDACSAPEGYTDNDADCDDENAAVNPDATELLNGIDDDCDGVIDDGMLPDWGNTQWPLSMEMYLGDESDDIYGQVYVAGVTPGAGAGYELAELGFGPRGSDPNEEPELWSWTDLVGYNTDVGNNDEFVGTLTPEEAGEYDYAWRYSVDGVNWLYADTSGSSSTDPYDPEYAAHLTVWGDADGDGVFADADCDDENDEVYPGADEVCNGIDDDCNGLVDGVDEGLTGAPTWYADADSDGFGDPASTTEACEAPTSYVADSGDCDDTDADVYPGATELVADGVDQDCNGEELCYLDWDNDGYRIDTTVPSTHLGCDTEGLALASAPDGDCEDKSAAIHPGALEVCNDLDDDCDGLVDDEDPSVSGESPWYADADSDGYGNPSVSAEACVAPTGYVADSSDCDDTSASIHPLADEVCDSVDNDCDTLVDGDDPGLVDGSTWYADTDSDSYGNASSSVEACEAPTGYVADSSDCDDTDAWINPAATEICDDVDNDCDGFIDDADAGVTGRDTWYADADADTYGDPLVTTEACEVPSGYTDDSSDCDDSNAAVHPGAAEICDDGLDNDCSEGDEECPTVPLGWCNLQWPYEIEMCLGETTESVYGQIWADGVTPGAGQGAGITAELGYGPVDSDPTDNPAWNWTEAAYNTDAGNNDEYLATLTPTDAELYGYAFRFSGDGGDTWLYCDSDGTSYGESYEVEEQGLLLVEGDDDDDGFVSIACGGDDCDDLDPEIYPGATEVCDPADVDEDCNGYADNADSKATGKSLLYPDLDEDTFGDADSAGSMLCDATAEFSVADNTDCDDTSADKYPGNTEVDDDLDNNCDDMVDEGFRAAGDLFLTEIMYNPAGSEPATEWIELYNPSSTRDIHMDGFAIYSSGNSGRTFYVAPDALVVPASGYVVLCHGSTTLGSLCDYVYGSNVNETSLVGVTFNASFTLTNGANTLLISLNGTTIDQVGYTTSSPWPLSSNGKSIELSVNHYDATLNNSGGNWCQGSTIFYGSDYGTPNALNVCSR